ncbi:MAG: hypothetical protein K8T25_06445 [Planctomycetia bacterium]|nr:hypothetical protein [Planctomycetia bacterium]
MSTFFLLALDSDRDDLETVADYEMGDFRVTALWKCRRFEQTIPDSVRLFVTEGLPSDYMGNPLSWPIVSDRLWSLVAPLVGSQCQILPVPLFYQHNSKPVTGYKLMHVTTCVSLKDSTKGGSPDTRVGHLVLPTKNVPSDVHIFRITESSTLIAVSEHFFNAISGKGIKGVALIKVKTS